MNSQERPGVVRVLGILGVAIALAGGCRTGFAQGTAQRPRTALAVWDTGQASAQALASEAVQQKSGWKLLPGSETATAFQGDAVISNGPYWPWPASREPGSRSTRWVWASRSFERVWC